MQTSLQDQPSLNSALIDISTTSNANNVQNQESLRCLQAKICFTRTVSLVCIITCAACTILSSINASQRFRSGDKGMGAFGCIFAVANVGMIVFTRKCLGVIAQGVADEMFRNYGVTHTWTKLDKVLFWR